MYQSKKPFFNVKNKSRNVSLFDYVQNHYNKKVAFNKRDKYDFLKRPACLRKENLYVALDYQLYRNKKYLRCYKGFCAFENYFILLHDFNCLYVVPCFTGLFPLSIDNFKTNNKHQCSIRWTPRNPPVRVIQGNIPVPYSRGAHCGCLPSYVQPRTLKTDRHVVHGERETSEGPLVDYGK